MKAFLAKLVGVTTNVINFFLPAMRLILATGLSALLPVAIEVVRSLNDKPMSGGDKFKLAVETLKNEAIVRGIEAGTNALEIVIVSAVAKLREGA
jgi:hypothetical protein